MTGNRKGEAFGGWKMAGFCCCVYSFTVLSSGLLCGRDHSLHIYTTYLKTSHITRISGVFETILIALHEEFQEKPATQTSTP